MSATSHQELRSYLQHDTPRQESLVPQRRTVKVYEHSQQQGRESGMSSALLDLIAYTTATTVTCTRRDRGSERRKGVVLVISRQRDLARALQPHLDAAGGDGSRIFVHPCRYRVGATERAIRLPEHAARLRDDILACGADIVVIDSLNDFLNNDSGHSVPQRLQDALSVLERIAIETEAAIVAGIVRTETAIRESATAQARPTLADPVRHKAASAPVTVPTVTSSPDRPAPSRHTGSARSVNAEARRNVHDAIGFLQRALSRGPCAGKDLEQLAALRGLKPRTLRTAREKLGILVWKSQSADGPWVWELPYRGGSDVKR